MRRALPQMLPWALFAAAPISTFALLRANPGLDFEAASPEGHFYIVSVVSLINVTLGIIASIAAVRSGNVRVLLLALAFTSMAAIFAVHGLATPGFIVSDEHTSLTTLSSRLSTLVAAAFLAASAVDLPARVNAILRAARVPILGGWILLLAALGIGGLLQPQLVSDELVSNPLFVNGSFVVVVALASFAAYQYFQGFRRSGLPMYGAVALGSVLIVQAQVGIQWGVKYHGTFWLYHVELLIGFSAIMWGLLVEYARGNSPIFAIESLTLRDPIEQIQAGYTDSITSLSAALEARDGYTMGHGERVAALATMIGEKMGLSPERLRSLHQGALLHDVGKIGVPDRVLHKPGRLTDEEYTTIKEHPGRGENMLAAAFSGRIEREVILYHHERLDGKGYPEGLSGSNIPLEARIAAVADVYDALRSSRSYRPSWKIEEAQQHIRENIGSHFDPDCVEAFFEVVGRWEQQYSAERAPYQEHRSAA